MTTKHLTTQLSGLFCAALFTVGTMASAQFTNPGTNSIQPRIAGQHAINPQKKAASDEAMQAGLSELQAAGSAEASGNASAATGSLQQAISSMTSALGIYHGYREKSIAFAKRALADASGTEKNALKRCEDATQRAIQNAQSALSVN